MLRRYIPTRMYIYAQWTELIVTIIHWTLDDNSNGDSGNYSSRSSSSRGETEFFFAGNNRRGGVVGISPGKRARRSFILYRAHGMQLWRWRTRIPSGLIIPSTKIERAESLILIRRYIIININIIIISISIINIIIIIISHIYTLY